MRVLNIIATVMAALLLVGGTGQAEAREKKNIAPLTDAEKSYAHYIRRQLWMATNGAPTNGLTGIVVFRFVVTRSGQVRSIELRKSSGHTFLDAVALRIIDRASPFKPMPAGIKENMTITIPFKFTR